MDRTPEGGPGAVGHVPKPAAPRLRKIRLTEALFDAAVEQVGGILALGPFIGRQNGCPDLRVVAWRPDGDFWVLVVHSEQFAEEKCDCRAPEWKDMALTL